MKVKFCGNCNPRVDPKRVKKALDDRSREGSEERLLVNGCERMCLLRKPADEREGAVMVNGWEMCGEGG